MTDENDREATQQPAPPPGQPTVAGGDGITGDAVIDAALRSLEEVPPDDLDAQIAAGQRVQQTLQSRLSDLGGE
jgi:hypothetical protein